MQRVSRSIAPWPTGARAATLALLLSAAAATHAQSVGAWAPVHVLQATFAASSIPEPPLLAMNGAGDALYAWNATGIVRVADRLAAGGWGASRSVPGANTAAGPVAVAIGRGGLAAVAWTTVATRYVPSQLLVSLRPAGGSFGAPVEIAPGTVAGAVRLGIDCAGNVTALWSNAYGISASTLAGPPAIAGACSGTAGSSAWGPVVQVSAAHAGAGLPQLTVNDAGSALAVWQEGAPGAPSAIVAALKPAGTAWQAPATVSAPTASATWNPLPGLDAAGNAAVAYLDGSKMTVVRRPAAGPWLGAEVVSGVQQVQYPAFAVADNGDMLAAWLAIDPATGATSVWQRLRGASIWGAEARLSGRNETPDLPSAALAGDASLAAVTWTDNTTNVARAALLRGGAWTRSALGPGYWGGLVTVAAGGGRVNTGWARTVNGNPNAAQLVGRGTP